MNSNRSQSYADVILEKCVKTINDNTKPIFDKYYEEINKYLNNDIANIVTEYAKYEMSKYLDSIGYNLFGKKEGRWIYKSYDADAYIVGECEYKNGYLHGKYTEWYKGYGRVKCRGEFKNGYEEGMWTYWYENGTKYKEGEYKNGYENNTWTFWRDNKQKFMVGEFKNGYEEGMWTHWRDNGTKSNWKESNTNKIRKCRSITDNISVAQKKQIFLERLLY